MGTNHVATSFEVRADPATVMAALLAVERLPEWSPAHREVRIETTDDQGRPARVRARMALFGTVDEQILEYRWPDERQMSWAVVHSAHTRRQDGSYRLSGSGASTLVDFRLEVEPRMPVPGLLVRSVQRLAADTTRRHFAAFVQQFHTERNR